MVIQCDHNSSTDTLPNKNSYLSTLAYIKWDCEKIFDQVLSFAVEAVAEGIPFQATHDHPHLIVSYIRMHK